MPETMSDELIENIISGDRTALGRGLTLVESSNPEDQSAAGKLMEKILPYSGKSLRIGVTGIPGAGKSTMIDALGSLFIKKGHKVAVLAVDPSSTKSGGSILGDKTRMAGIANDPMAFVRPSPTSGSSGGTTRSARESIAILEAGGYDIVFLETVGVGQAELSAVDMVDFFMVLVIPGAGDELQGIKRGIVELADMIVVNKADSKDEAAVNSAVGDYQSALHLLYPQNTPPVQKASALKNSGLEEILEILNTRHQELLESGRLKEIRREQQIKWFWALLESGVLGQIKNYSPAKKLTAELEEKILSGELNAGEAAQLFISKVNFS